MGCCFTQLYGEGFEDPVGVFLFCSGKQLETIVSFVLFVLMQRHRSAEEKLAGNREVMSWRKRLLIILLCQQFYVFVVLGFHNVFQLLSTLFILICFCSHGIAYNDFGDCNQSFVMEPWIYIDIFYAFGVSCTPIAYAELLCLNYIVWEMYADVFFKLFFRRRGKITVLEKP